MVISESRDRVLEAGDPEIGWLARKGHVPLGYLNDQAKTKATFPSIDGVRYVVPGDRARILPDASIEVLGRESTTINTGGEKVFGEEVEAALLSHHDVEEALVVGRPSERWGQEVVAIIVRRGSTAPTPEDLGAHVTQQLARYKVPKRWYFTDAIPRTASGKADYPAATRLCDQEELRVLNAP